MDHDNRKSDLGDLQEVMTPTEETTPRGKANEKKGSRLVAYVRFTPEEHSKIRKLAQMYGKTLPELLKECFFKNPPQQPSLSAEDARAMFISLNRIGNNVNQLARRVNSGFREGFIAAFDDVRDDLRALKNFAVGLNGSRQA